MGGGVLGPLGLALEAVERLGLSGRRLSGGPGVLVAVEGVDGAGVSTVAESVAHALRLLGLRSCYTKEPTMGPVGYVIRQMLGGAGGPFSVVGDPRISGLLFAADRLWHLVGEPGCGFPSLLCAIRNGAVVVSDRYKYSSLAYQSVESVVDGRRLGGAPREWLWAVNSYAPPAHILVYLDVGVDVAMGRIRRGRFHVEAYEEESRLARVRNAFKSLLERLRVEPEYPPPGGGEPPWLGWVEEWAPGSSRAWTTPGRPLPVIVEVDSSRGPLEVVSEVVGRIHEVLVSMGFRED